MHLTTASPLADWPRKFFRPGGGNAFLFYVVHGRIDTTLSLSRGKYRSKGIPAGFDSTAYGPTSGAETTASFRNGPMWDRLLKDDPALAATIAAEESCLVLRGQVADPSTLNYLRDAVGFLTFCLDAGGVAIYDPQILAWWGPTDWRSRLFDVGLPAPMHHAVILVSEDAANTEWIHTRGMRKFGRPDLSIHAVPPQSRNAVIDLCNRFIEILAFGGIIEDGQEIRMQTLPRGMRCFNRGDQDDPNFNNVHVEIEWP